LAGIRSPVAFAHAYDLGLLLSAAVAQASSDDRWTEGHTPRRAALRDALEALEAPVDGLLKTYSRPFTEFSDAKPDGHEALSQEDLCLVHVTRDGGVEGYAGGPKP
jgi:branched-chain amino acid transport system substrate-binding protein